MRFFFLFYRFFSRNFLINRFNLIRNFLFDRLTSRFNLIRNFLCFFIFRVFFFIVFPTPRPEARFFLFFNRFLNDFFFILRFNLHRRFILNNLIDRLLFIRSFIFFIIVLIASRPEMRFFLFNRFLFA